MATAPSPPPPSAEKKNENEVITTITGKQYVTPDGLLKMSYRLARMIVDSGFKPQFTVAIWRGGTPIGIAIQEFLAYQGIHTDHIALRTSSYKVAEGPGATSAAQVQVFGLQYVVEKASAEDNLLLVDDIWDTGRSVEAVLVNLRRLMRKNLPKTIKVAVPFFKPSRNTTKLQPDYYLQETDKWVVFPHELDGLNDEEILQVKGKEIFDLVHPPAR